MQLCRVQCPSLPMPIPLPLPPYPCPFSVPPKRVQSRAIARASPARGKAASGLSDCGFGQRRRARPLDARTQSGSVLCPGDKERSRAGPASTVLAASARVQYRRDACLHRSSKTADDSTTCDSLVFVTVETPLRPGTKAATLSLPGPDPSPGGGHTTQDTMTIRVARSFVVGRLPHCMTAASCRPGLVLLERPFQPCSHPRCPGVPGGAATVYSSVILQRPGIISTASSGDPRQPPLFPTSPTPQASKQATNLAECCHCRCSWRWGTLAN